MKRNELKQLIRETIKERMKLREFDDDYYPKSNAPKTTDNKGVSPEDVTDTAKKFKQNHGNRINMFRNDIIDLVTNPTSEFREYYPNWNVDNFKQYYKEIYGEEYTD